MSCPGINQYLTSESGRFLPDYIFRRMFGKSPWFSLTRRGAWPAGLGQIINLLYFERNAPYAADPEWTPMTIQDGSEGGSCLQPAESIEFGSTTRTMRLYRRILEGPDFCADDTRPVFEVSSQLTQLAGIIADRVMLEWEMRDRNTYSDMVQTKVVVDSPTSPTTNSNATGSGYPAACATQTLGLGMLENYKLDLLRNGAADSALLTANGGAVMTVVGSPEYIGNLTRQNSTLRQDIQFATQGQGMNALLLQGFGISYTIQNFMFMEDPFPNRFNCVGGVPVKVPTFIRQSATTGFKAEINPAWKTADMEEVFIYDPTVFTQLVPTPITNPGPGFQFNPVSYTGSVKWLNIQNRQCNPDGTIGFHRVVMAAAAEPVNTWRGVGFLVKRCAVPSGNQVTCAT